MLPARQYLYSDHDVFEGIHADFFIIVLRFFLPYSTTNPTATKLAFSSKNDELGILFYSGFSSKIPLLWGSYYRDW